MRVFLSYSLSVIILFFFFLTADILADILLTVLPIVFLHGVKLSREPRILILSTFSVSMVINVVTIIHAIFLFELDTSGSIFIGHIKASTRLTLITTRLMSDTCAVGLANRLRSR